MVTENAYGMLKGRWRILYKKTECKMHNLKYIIMASIMLHNLCIELDDPCKPRWKLAVKELELFPKSTGRSEDKRGEGVTTYIFLIRMYPMITKGEPKAGAGFLTNYQPKSGANHICYKNATQSRRNLVSVQIDILFGEKPAEKIDRGQHMSQRRGDFFILNENPTQCRLGRLCKPITGGGGGGHPDLLTNTSHLEDKCASNLNRMKISNWLWSQL